MQEENLRLRALRVGALPILNCIIARMGLAEELSLALNNPGYAEALQALIKNILVERNALYAVGDGRHFTMRDWLDGARLATTSSDALLIDCLQRIGPPCRRASC